MGGVKWTAEQLQAIETRDRNLLVSAGAGAGKTAVLVERVMRMITDPVRPVDVNRILVVTFTNAAAEEMRVRVGGALRAALRADPGSPLLNRQAALLEQAAVTTLHSFCLDTVRRYFHLLDLDPAFRVGDEHELSLLRSDVLTALFEARYAEPATADRFSRLVEIYGGDKGDLGLQELVLRLYDFARSTPRPRQWFDRALAFWDVEDIETPADFPWMGELLRLIQLDLTGAEALLEQAARVAFMPDGPAVYLQVLESEIDGVRGLAQAAGIGWAELAAKFGDFECTRLPPSRGGDTALRERARELRGAARKILQDLDKVYFSRAPEEWRRDMRAVRPVLSDLVDLTVAFGEAFTAAKRDRGLVDFSDLEHLCLRVLCAEREGDPAASPVAHELSAWYREVMVDEYQDINGIQETILKMIRRGDEPPGLFLVGDVKQSIYRFRLAEPDLFLHRYHAFPPLRKAPGRDARVDLSRNFRSRRVIIGAVNDIFGQIMSARTAEIDYDERAQLNYGADYPPAPGPEDPDAAPVELHVIDCSAKVDAAGGKPPDDDPGDETQGAYETAEAEALLAAARIKELVEGVPGRVYDRRQRCHRPVTYSDVTILLRSVRGWANTFVEVFHRCGIPVFADLGSGYFAAVEVEAMLSLLTIIDNPRQDIPLAGVLRSPWCGFSAGDLAAIRTSKPDGDGDFYECVLAAAAGDGPTAVRLQAFLARLDGWRTLARRKPLSELIWQLYRDTGFYGFVGGLPGGAQRQANLRALHHRARQYERTTYRGLFRFLRFIERVREKGDDLGTARPLGENEDVVRIMSVHRSKGLEFPVVILAGLGKQFNFRDCYKEVLLHKELGLAADVVDPELRLRYPTLFKHLVRARLKKEALAEEMRILYVALTRARERLILIGSGAPEKLWKESSPAGSPALNNLNVLKARSLLEWITPVCPRNGEGSRWAVHVVNPALLSGDNSERAPGPADPAITARLKNLARVDAAKGALGEVRRRLEWRYRRLPETVRPVKLTATGLRRRFEPAPGDAAPLGPYRLPLIRQPRCLQEAVPLTAAEYGTALHKVMQHIDWNATRPDDVQRELERMQASEIISAQQAAAVDSGVIARFLQSGPADRVRKGIAFQREVPFTLRLPAAQFYPDVQADEFVLVMGVIDGLLTEEDGFVIIDYKTDRTPPGGERAVAERYRGQLDLYAEAVGLITGRRVKEKYIYLFDVEKAVRL